MSAWFCIGSMLILRVDKAKSILFACKLSVGRFIGASDVAYDLILYSCHEINLSVNMYSSARLHNDEHS